MVSGAPGIPTAMVVAGGVTESPIRCALNRRLSATAGSSNVKKTRRVIDVDQDRFVVHVSLAEFLRAATLFPLMTPRRRGRAGDGSSGRAFNAAQSVAASCDLP